MRIAKTTDSRHIGIDIKDDVALGDTIELAGFYFYVQKMTFLPDGTCVLSNPNYQILLEE